MTIFTAIAITQQTAAEPLVIERTLAPGIAYIQEYRAAEPLLIHVVKFKFPTEAIRFEPRLAKDEIFAKDRSISRETVDSIARRTGALVAVNADFFGWDGDPLGVQLSRGSLISEPFVPRAAAAWTESGVQFDSPKAWNAALTIGEETLIEINGINRSCRAGEAIWNSRSAGVASSKELCYAFVFEVQSEPTPGKSIEAKFKLVIPEAQNVPVKEGEAILLVTQERGKKLIPILTRDTVYSVRCELQGGIDWSVVREAVGGGPWLLKSGKSYITNLYERFDVSLTNRHPRTAMGTTEKGEVVLCVVDGRSPFSRGVTLEELASIMQRYGCQDAINLDGGGSSTLAIAGSVVNRPSDGVPRPVANALCLFSLAEPSPAAKLEVATTTTEWKPGTTGSLRLRAGDKEVPANEVVWTGYSAAGWVDAAGTVRVTGHGLLKVTAVSSIGSTSTTISIPKPEPKKG